MLSRITCPKIEMTRGDNEMVTVKQPNLMTVKLVILFVVSLVFVYSLGCVYSASFYITEWRQEERGMTCALWFIAFVFFAGAIIQEEVRKQKVNNHG